MFPERRAANRSLVPWALLFPFLLASSALAQQGILIGGVVVSATSGQSLPYSTVSVTNGPARFSNADGSFSLTLPPGRYAFRIRQLGYAPLDTIIPVNPGADLHALSFALTPVAIRLAAVRTFASSCRAGESPGELGGILDELTKNAEREKLLRNEYPFLYDFERWTSIATGSGPDQQLRIDTVRFNSRVSGGYKPGVLVRPVNDSVPNGPREMRIPELIDVAEPLFLVNHCFRFRGMERVAEAPAYRVDFKPSSNLKEADVEGEVYIDSASYMIRKSVFRLTRPERLNPPIVGLEVTTEYHEIFKGVALFERIKSIQPLTRSYRFRTEQVQNQKLVAVRFYGRTPDDIEISGPQSALASQSIAPRPVVDSLATLSGTVQDSAGHPLRGAQIILSDGSARAESGDSGQFTIRHLKPGKTDVTVRVLGYGPATFSTVLRAARNRRMRVILTPVSVQLSTIVVMDSLSDPLLNQTGFFERKRRGWGTFISPEEIQRRNPARASDMLRTINGVEIASVGRTGTLPLSTRALSITGRCMLNVFVDGTRAYISSGMTLEDVISGSEVGAMEVYATATETPPQFIGGNFDCGALVIWTKGWLSSESEPDSTKK